MKEELKQMERIFDDHLLDGSQAWAAQSSLNSNVHATSRGWRTVDGGV